MSHMRSPEDVFDFEDDAHPSPGNYQPTPVYPWRGDKRRTKWSVESLLLWWTVSLVVGGFFLLALCWLSGCVSAGYKSGTITHPDGRKETYRSASYVDAREGAKGAADFVGGLGDGLLGSGGVAGLLGGGGVVGALGLLWRNAAVAKARKVGEDEGYEYAKNQYAPPPPSVLPPPPPSVRSDA